MQRNLLYIIGVLILIIIVGAGYFFVQRQKTEPQRDAQSMPGQMTFFLSSINPGSGANLGGLAGADNYCQALAASAGVGDKTWHAYLSTTAADDAASVNARDRIGNGPWQNFQGAIIASNIEELHNNNNINKQTALTEKGHIINGRGDTPNIHDILTGSGPDGRVLNGDADTTCGNWTKGGDGGAIVGHSDRIGTSDTDAARSWNSSHLSRGCSLEALASSGGRGLFYCFAVTQ